jgi:UDP-N-acetylmuramoyl-L-alanyl-D-glutamate--2,6-diaminopimelate ligase
MKLTELLQGIVADSIPLLEINAITDDSRKACENALFVCISGALFDGHSYAQAAYKNGCRAFVVQKEVRLPSDAYVCRVLDTRAALAGLACRFYGNPSHKMRLFGITGTKGKTTTAQLIAHLLNSSGIPCGYIGTSGIDYLDHHEVTQNTTPDPLTLQKTLAEMLQEGIEYAVMEVSAHALYYQKDAPVHYSACVFTNFTQHHLDFFPSMEEYGHA